jgi:hypothetical protein
MTEAADDVFAPLELGIAITAALLALPQPPCDTEDRT